jgi:hypothetical protein
VILKALDKNSSRRHLTLRLFLTEVEALNAPGAAVAPAAAGGNREVGFAKTMLFAGGQAEVASLVAKAIAARTGGTHATPAGGSPATAAPMAAQAPLTMQANAPSPSVASTMLASGGNGQEAASAHVARLTPPPGHTLLAERRRQPRARDGGGAGGGDAPAGGQALPTIPRAG